MTQSDTWRRLPGETPCPRGHRDDKAQILQNWKMSAA